MVAWNFCCFGAALCKARPAFLATDYHLKQILGERAIIWGGERERERERANIYNIHNKKKKAILDIHVYLNASSTLGYSLV